MFSISLTTIFYFFSFLLILFSGNWRARFQKISNNFAAFSFWILFTLFVIGTFYSVSPTDRITLDLRDQNWLLITPFLIMIIKEDRWRQRMINAFLAIMIITLAISFLKTIFHLHPISAMHFYKPRPQHKGFLWDHITQSYAMNIAAFICAYRFIFENKSKLLYGILFLLMTVDIIFISEGRTGYGIFFLLLLYLSWVRFRWRGLSAAITLTILMIGIAFFASSVFQARIKSTYINTVYYHQMREHNQSTSVGKRIQMLQVTKILFQKRPWFGYGTGGIETPIKTIVPYKDRALLLSNTNSVESIYLNYALQFGVVGLMIFLLMLTIQIRTSFQLPKDYRYLMHIVLIATLFGGLFCSFFNNFPVKHVFALFSALCFSALQSNSFQQHNIGKKII
ncbi:MAG: hypothetical protein A3E81_04580 [Gammaproteobacteria bacterium RIFCSPHIGHO2_12_FULL_36_30]|nr:MAG: hypothetical protein A3E81_04580 [Gammaproteobacteria bacterium RIFCSPHIGHO2_12_FULL_36_30]